MYFGTANADLDIDTVGLRRVSKNPDEQIRYNCNGAVVSRTQTTATTGVKWTYTWDENHRLVATQLAGQSPSKFVYDATGQRVLRVDPDGTKTIYLGSTELRWSPSTPSTIRVARYYPGGTQRAFDGAVRYAIGGYQGSLLATINATTGNITHNRYLPYGGLRAGTTPVDKGFLGQTQDPSGGLVYLNNRYHDPNLGVFISVDPLVATTGEPYIYASGNPTTLSDPSGLDPCPKSGCSWTDSGGRSPCARSEGDGSLTCGSGFVNSDSTVKFGTPSPRLAAWERYTTWGQQFWAPQDEVGALIGIAITVLIGGSVVALPVAIETCVSAWYVCGSSIGGAGRAVGPTVVDAANGGGNVAGPGGAVDDLLVLGLRDGLDDLANRVGGRTLLGYEGDAFQQPFRDAVANPSTRFVFSLDNMAGSGPQEIVENSLYIAKTSLRPGATNWELGQLWSGNRLGDVTFMHNGVPVIVNLDALPVP